MPQSPACTFLSVSLFLIAACEKAASSPPGIQRRVTLESVSSCGQLTSQVQDAAVRQMRSQLDVYKTGIVFTAAAGGSNKS